MYRVLGDFYPTGATPQLIAKTVLVPGAPQTPAKLTGDYGPKKTTDLKDGAAVPMGFCESDGRDHHDRAA